MKTSALWVLVGANFSELSKSRHIFGNICILGLKLQRPINTLSFDRNSGKRKIAGRCWNRVELTPLFALKGAHNFHPRVDKTTHTRTKTSPERTLSNVSLTLGMIFHVKIIPTESPKTQQRRVFKIEFINLQNLDFRKGSPVPKSFKTSRYDFLEKNHTGYSIRKSEYYQSALYSDRVRHRVEQ